MAKAKQSGIVPSVEEFEAAKGEAPFIPGKAYLYAVPGGFLMRGWYVKPLGVGCHRFIGVDHMRNAGTVELPEMCRSGRGPQTQYTSSRWRTWNGCPIWWAPDDSVEAINVD